MAAITAAATPSGGPGAPMQPSLNGDEWLRMRRSLPHDEITYLPITIGIVSIVVSLAATGLRIYTRHRLLRNLGFDDMCAVLAVLGVIALAVVVFIQINYGLGTHGWDLRDRTNTIKYGEVTIYSVSLLFIKLGVSWQYYRIVKHDSRYRIPCLVIICAVVGWSFASMFALAFVCYPAEVFWLEGPFSDKCDFKRGYIVAVGNVVSDFILVLVPMPVVFRLNVKTPQKLSLLGLFAIGFFACIVALLRFLHIPKDFDSKDSDVSVAAWTQAEVATGVLGSCAMTLQPLFKHWRVNLGLAKRFRRRPSKDGDGEASFQPTLQKRLDSRPSDSMSNSPGKAPRVRSWEGSETELTRIDDADETETVRRVESQCHVSLPQLSPTFSPFGPPSPGGGIEWRRSRHDLDPRGLVVLAQTQCCAGPSGDDKPPVMATADEGRETRGKRSSQLGIQIKRAWSVQGCRHDEGQ